MKNELVVLKKGKMTVTSLELVEEINKFREIEESRAKLEHYDLLKIIRDEFSEEIDDGKISCISYKDTMNRKQPAYELTSSQAKQILARESKIVRKALISHIEKLEDFIREKQSAGWLEARAKGKLARKDETDIIRDKLIPLAIEQGSKSHEMFYMTYSKLVNSIIGINSDMRESLPYHYLRTIEMLERIIENIISAEVDSKTHYKEIYQICKAKCGLAVELSFLPKLELIA